MDGRARRHHALRPIWVRPYKTVLGGAMQRRQARSRSYFAPPAGGRRPAGRLLVQVFADGNIRRAGPQDEILLDLRGPSGEIEVGAVDQALLEIVVVGRVVADGDID